VAYEAEGMQPLAAWPSRKGAYMALSVFGTITSSSDADKKIVKLMEDIQDFVSKIYKQSLKQRSTESYFTKQLRNIKFLTRVKFSLVCICISCVLNVIPVVIKKNSFDLFHLVISVTTEWKMANLKLEFLLPSILN
jgi:hypothetical protein